MKLFRLLLIFSGLILLAFDGSSQTRRVFFYPGLNENPLNWDPVRDRLVSASINDLNVSSANNRFVDYNDNDGLETMVNTANADLTGFTDGGNGDIAIGHSLGGLVIRQTEMMAANGGLSPLFEGYITIGTPNMGAPIAASYKNGEVEDFLFEGCNRVVTQPAAAINIWLGSQIAAVPVAWVQVIGTFVSSLTLATNPYVTMLCNDQIFENLDGMEQDAITLEEISNGSDEIIALSAFESQMKRICIITEEVSPVHWKLAGSQDVTDWPINDLENWSDLEVATQVAGGRAQMNNISIVLFGIAVANTIETIFFFSWHKLVASVSATTAAISLRRAISWIDNTETRYNILIGATETVNVAFNDPTPSLSQNCINAWAASGIAQWEAWYYGVLNNEEQNNCYPDIQSIEFQNSTKSDGFIPYVHQQIPDIAMGGTDDIIIEIDQNNSNGVNHAEHMNHERIHELYENIFTGLEDNVDGWWNAN